MSESTPFVMSIINTEVVINIIFRDIDGNDSHYRRRELADEIAWEYNSCSEWMDVYDAGWLEAMYQDVLRNNPKPLKHYD